MDLVCCSMSERSPVHRGVVSVVFCTTFTKQLLNNSSKTPVLSVKCIVIVEIFRMRRSSDFLDVKQTFYLRSVYEYSGKCCKIVNFILKFFLAADLFCL